MMRFAGILTTAIVAAAAGYFAHDRFFAESESATPQTAAIDLAGKPLVGQRRPDYTLGSIDGSVVSASEFDGRVVLVNFWATWCAPCREEMPMLMDIRHRYRSQGLEVVGIALDDVERARGFAEELGIDYPMLVGSTDVMAMARVYGNESGALPYSVLIDRDGIVQWTLLGVLEEEALVARIEALISDI